MYVKNYQKRGLPHANILITLSERDRLNDSSDIDKTISAKIPAIPTMCCDPKRKVQAVKLRATALRCMIQGPCGNTNSRSQCMVDGKCSKNFPQVFSRESVWDDTANYKQQSPSNGGETGIVGDFQVDNQWVVPYCPYLFLKFDAHTNTEASISRNSSKYIFMYINRYKTTKM